MQTPTLIDPRLEIAETLFEARAEICYVLARPLTQELLSPMQRGSLERVLKGMETIQSALEKLPG